MRAEEWCLDAQWSGGTMQVLIWKVDEVSPILRLYRSSPMCNKFEITIARAILIYSIIRGEDVRDEELIADNIAVIAQGMQGKGKLSFPSTIHKLCKDAQVPFHEFRRTELISQDKPITARLMETTRLGRIVQAQQQQNEEKEDQPMPQFEGDMQLQQQQFFENMQSTQAQYLEELKTVKARQDELWNNTNMFHHQIRKEQDMIAREIQEVKKFQVNQTLMGFRKEAVEKLE
ncbi:hypothetical protein PIB30_069055 [Stylosanthes scabra]|uniref:Uncharacterized protein n=1 Tax=Stylosanthes scabra TaxID=79078 RepID=A0ABU6QNG5_9FABA|nr:hypothetical protein [Stylosanthes scabra]